MEVSNIYTVVDRSDPRGTSARPPFEVSRPVTLLLLPGDLDEPEQQECRDHRERANGLVARVDSGEAHGSGEDEGRDPGVPD